MMRGVMKSSGLLLTVVVILLVAGLIKAEGGERPICTNPDTQMNPKISGNKVVWQDYRNDNTDIYLYDLETGVERPICTNLSGQYIPEILGNMIVWVDDRHDEFSTGNDDIYLYDLETSTEIKKTRCI